MILSRKRITKVLISLRVCAGWSAPLSFANPENSFFSRRCPLKARIQLSIHVATTSLSLSLSLSLSHLQLIAGLERTLLANTIKQGPSTKYTHTYWGNDKQLTDSALAQKGKLQLLAEGLPRGYVLIWPNLCPSVFCCANTLACFVITQLN